MKKNTHIINQDGSVASQEFEMNGKKYKITGTLSTGWKAIQAIDTIKNIKTGTYKDVPRIKLFNVTRKNIITNKTY